MGQFDGTLLFVSHDRYFIRALAGKILELKDGAASLFAGGYDEYTASKAAQKEAEVNPKDAAPKPRETGYRTKEERAAETKKRLRIKEIETEISALEGEENEINGQLALPEVAGNYALLKEKCERLEEIKRRVDALYAEYDTLL